MKLYMQYINLGLLFNISTHQGFTFANWSWDFCTSYVIVHTVHSFSSIFFLKVIPQRWMLFIVTSFCRTLSPSVVFCPRAGWVCSFIWHALPQPLRTQPLLELLPGAKRELHRSALDVAIIILSPRQTSCPGRNHRLHRDTVSAALTVKPEPCFPLGALLGTVFSVREHTGL